MFKKRFISLILSIVLCLSAINHNFSALGLDVVQQSHDCSQTFSEEPSQTDTSISPMASPANLAELGECLSEEEMTQFGRGAIPYTTQQQSRSSEVNNTPLIIGINTLAKERIEAEYGYGSCSGKNVYSIGYEFNNEYPVSPSDTTPETSTVQFPSCSCVSTCSYDGTCICIDICTCLASPAKGCYCTRACDCGKTEDDPDFVGCSDTCSCITTCSCSNPCTCGIPSHNSTSFPEELLPSAVDNSTLPSFPFIGNQGSSNSCTAWSIGYYQLTNNTALVRGLNAKNNDENTMSPRFMYNLINKGTNVGTQPIDAMNVACSFGCATVAQTDIVDSAYDNIDTWNFGADVWESALANKAKSAYVFDTTSTNLSELKRLLTNGYVASFMTHVNYWIFRAAPVQSGENICIGARNYEGITPGWHTMTIVGYDDNMWIDLDGSGDCQDNERGAIKVANSWGSTAHFPTGYCWVLYSALSMQNGDPCGKIPVIDQNLVYFLEPSVSYTPLLLAEVTLNTAKRDELSIEFAAIDANPSEDSLNFVPVTEHLRHTFTSKSNWEPVPKQLNLAFKTYPKTPLEEEEEDEEDELFSTFTTVSVEELLPSDATFRFDLTPAIQKYFNCHSDKYCDTSYSFNVPCKLSFYIRIHDLDDNEYPNILKSFKIKDSKNNRIFQHDTETPQDADGIYVLDDLDCDITPRLVTSTKTFVATLNHPIQTKDIFSGVLVKPKLTNNTYGTAANNVKLLNATGTKVTIQPPEVDNVIGKKYVENQYYTIILSDPLKTPGGNVPTDPITFDFYVLKPPPESQENLEESSQ